MKTLQEIKEAKAKALGFKSFNDLFSSEEYSEAILDEICYEYAGQEDAINNGWNIILSEDCLPKTKGQYRFKYRGSNERVNLWYSPKNSELVTDRFSHWTTTDHAIEKLPIF